MPLSHEPRRLAHVPLYAKRDQRGMVAAIKIYLNMENPGALVSAGGVENLAWRSSVFMAPLYPWAFARTQDPRRLRDHSRCTSAGFSRVSAYPNQPSAEGVEMT
ncbi:hypothetical protein GCM10010276_88790 [Streptomyces longisporus]|uniref:Uncharacterized protein n=1 Tax=Streptomyces longisporus TaxID=1948 RepID=A0ABP6AUG1_STRLO